MLRSLENIGEIYIAILTESPDNIMVDGKYYDYDRSDLGNYTGYMSYNGGKYVMSKDVIGHGELASYILRDSDDHDKLITNTKDLAEIRGIVRDRVKFRIWPKFKVFSLWMYSRNPSFNEAVINSITAAGGDPKEYRYDLDRHDYEEFKTYDEYFDEVSDEEQSKRREQEIKNKEAERMLADIQAGARRKPINYDDVPVRQPSWMRDGD